jgi:multicomponent Na+:H+ antiporter subunit G
MNAPLDFDEVRKLAGGVLALSGALIGLTGSLGVVRFPDFYTRLHPAGKTDTLAQSLVMLGVLCTAPDRFTALKLLLMSGILLITSPTGTFALARAAYVAGLRPWGVRDEGEPRG